MLDDLGLAGGLASLAGTLPDLSVTLDLADDRLPEHVEVALYRIAQEALQNVVKHARASSARLSFSVGHGNARLEVSDDGIGFDSAAQVHPTDAGSGYGMHSMAERAELVGGRLTVHSRPGSGTTVFATVPMR